MKRYLPYLRWIDQQQAWMLSTLEQWVNINSFSLNLAGLREMAHALVRDFAVLGEPIEMLDVDPYQVIDAHGHPAAQPLGRAMSIRSNSAAAAGSTDAQKPRVLLNIHMDTVYPPDEKFDIEPLGDDKIIGPGVTDAKGGLCVMLTALMALKRSPWADQLAWEVLVNPDEELGSPGSLPLLQQAARRNDIGLVFESATEAGTMIAARKGSGNFTVVLRGRAAHAGRAIKEGRNAIEAAAHLVLALTGLNRNDGAVTLNVGNITGGGNVNVVPDLAICRFNLRVVDAAHQAQAQRAIEQIISEVAKHDGISADMYGAMYSPPKPVDAQTRVLMDAVETCATDLQTNVSWMDTGGVSDGNKLAAAGLPNIDALGVRGGALHSCDEFLVTQSLSERAKLTALLLMRFASGDLPMPTRNKS